MKSSIHHRKKYGLWSFCERVGAWRTNRTMVAGFIFYATMGSMASLKANESSDVWIAPRIFFATDLTSAVENESDDVTSALARQLGVRWSDQGGKPPVGVTSISEIDENLLHGGRSLILTTGYDYLTARERGAKVDIIMALELTGRVSDPLPLPAPSGRIGAGAFTEFVLVVPLATETIDQLISGNDREKPTLLTHSDGCGRLCDIWIDRFLPTHTGDKTRASIARIRSVPSASNAVLAVYFNEAKACVVSRRAYDAVLTQNPGMGDKLRELGTSGEPLLTHVVACANSLTSVERSELVEELSSTLFEAGGQRWRVTAAQASHLKTLQPLISGAPAKSKAASASAMGVPISANPVRSKGPTLADGRKAP